MSAIFSNFITIILIPVIITIICSLFFLYKGDAIKKKRAIHLKRKETKKEHPHNEGDIPFAYIGNQKTSIISCVGTGTERIRSKHITSLLRHEAITLPEQLTQRREQIEQSRAMYNTKQVALHSFKDSKTDYDEQQHLTLQFVMSDYYTYQATNAQLDKPFPNNTYPSIRSGFLQGVDDWRKPIPFLANGVGVIGTVITSDHQVILTKRNSHTGVRPGEWDVSVVEAIDPVADRSSTQSGPDIVQSVIRGVEQEVGLQIDPDQVHILGLALDMKYYQWNLFATIKVEETFQEVIQVNSAGVHGSNEIDRYHRADVSIESFAELFPRDDIWDTGKWALYWTLLYEEKQRSRVHKELVRIFKKKG
ncbi:hypothetical protein [Alkalihalobacillus pseudalcaliphilus]|uniref:hypothetical protein n=1 Tax=Alkalihalobacillus pseudalcaliphilus TaxID=79884 RepID=UPI00064D7B69|nr:hypothetical protein [Alkalihalobacillus pseudalcaliphilus]KMK77371.1 hypothetical protein AB990_02490 [Alkalihalobacillus pseudalcaliphilus]